MAKEVYRVEIPIIVEDKTDAPLKQAERKINRFERSAQKTNERIRRMFGREVKLHIAAVDKVWPIAMKIQSQLRGLTSRVWKVTLEAKDKVTGTVRSVVSRITSPLALLGAGAGVYGVSKLTTGAAMQFEEYLVSMEHWLKGNKRAAQEVMQWVERFSDVTPFTPEELFPGMARAIGITKGAIEPAKRLVALAGEMAALTPGKRVIDAMEALADAQVGEFERMKEFGMKITQEEYKAMGGWEGFVVKAEGVFKGGMQGLSRTAVGLLSTIIGRIQTLFRSAGFGILEAVKPRLEKIVDWFVKNQKTVEKWKRGLKLAARDAFERMLRFGERTLGRINEMIKSPEFERADWGTKLQMILSKAADVVIPEVGRYGAQIGSRLIAGISRGVASAVGQDPLVAALLGFWVGTKVPGPLWLKVTVGVSIAAVPYVKRFLEAVFGGVGRHLPGTEYYVERKVQETHEVYKKFEEAKKTTPAGEPLIKGGGIWARHAQGGIFTRPHIGLVAEAGPEAVIPLAPRWRYRAENIVSRIAPSVGHTVNIYLDGAVRGSFYVSGDETKLIRRITDRVSEELAKGLRASFQNMPRISP